MEEILRIAQEKGIPVHLKKIEVFEQNLADLNHQGIAALAEGFAYADLNRVIQDSLSTRGHALLLGADHITDEGNLGALMRTAAFFGVRGLILPKDRSAHVTGRVRKRSSGAYAYLPVARVVNLSRALDQMEKQGFWIIGAAEEGSVSLYEFDWKRDLILILGSEDRGISRSVRKRCHELVMIPSPGSLGTLNVSVAGGIILSEIVRQRGGPVSGRN